MIWPSYINAEVVRLRTIIANEVSINAQGHLPKLANSISYNLRTLSRVDSANKGQIQKSGLVYALSFVAKIGLRTGVTILQNIAWMECLNNRATLAGDLEEAGLSGETHAFRKTRKQVIAARCHATLAVNDNVWRESFDRLRDSPKIVSPSPSTRSSARNCGCGFLYLRAVICVVVVEGSVRDKCSTVYDCRVGAVE